MGIPILLYQCEKIDDSQKTVTAEEAPLLISIAYGNEHYATTNPEIYQKLKNANQNNIAARGTDYSNDYDLYFNLNRIQIIEKNTYTQYTIVVENEEQSNVLLNYILLIYNNGDEFQYLAIYPRVETAGGLEIDYYNTTLINLDGQSLLGRGNNPIDCADGQPQFIDVTQVYSCEEKMCGGQGHGPEDEGCLCGTIVDGFYHDCARASYDCGWTSVIHWSCTGGGSAGGPDGNSNGHGNGGNGDDNDDDDDEPIGTIPLLDVEGTEASEPCNNIAAQITDPDYIAAKAFLDGKIGEPIEYGKTFNTNGDYDDIPQNPNNGNELDVVITPTTVGFMHTHLNDVVTVLPNGTISTQPKIRMFSPKDLRTFLLMLQNANNNNIDPADIFVDMFSSNGDYTLRFDGNINDVVSNITPALLDYLGSNKADEDYLKDIKKYKRERGVLKFIESKIEINGLNLYKVQNNGTIKRKYLNENGKLKTNKCEQ